MLSKAPIAVTGIGCRFPGGANDPASFWKLLCDGTDAIREVPRERWDVERFFHPEPGKPGRTYSKWGGFIDGIDNFDPGFFRISAREAAAMDPQQRVLLEVAWEALEDAGEVIDLEGGSNTGVFIGISAHDYSHVQLSTSREAIDAYSGTGEAASIAANRISYCLNLSGPSIAVDTACSSSLVAVHLACRSLRAGECELALAGGVNIMLVVEHFIAFSQARMFSPEGRCKSFDAGGNGFVRGEGAATVLLKPLPAALRDGDSIYAVIRGTASNQDGRTVGISVPNQRAQAALVLEACDDAGISPADIQFVEAHGTGTAVGDPIEARALGAALGSRRPDGDVCYLGSVKTNIGHLESAAGIAGLIKAALALKHRLVPPNLHYHTPNPNIDFEKLKLQVPVTCQPLGSNGRRLFAGVNSFGFGGANAHAVLEEPPARPPQIRVLTPGAAEYESASDEAAARRVLLPLSAHTPEALQASARAYVEFLQPGDGGAPRLADICFTAGSRRRHHAHRLAVVGAGREELILRLTGFIGGERDADVANGEAPAGRNPRLVFVFSGQGPQWWGMGRELLRQERVYRDTIAQCDRLLRECGSNEGSSLWAELHASEIESRMTEVATSHWGIFSLQVALVALWRSWGITPDAVIGHSIGEIAAAHVAGVLSLEDAVRLIFHRGRCLEQLGATGRMLAAGLSRPEAEELVAPWGDRASLAAVNSSSSVTLSGDAEAIETIARHLEQRQIFAKLLQVTFPFHSAVLDPIREEFCDIVRGLRPRSATLPFFSTVTGEAIGTARLDEDYWWRNARRPVLFAAATEAAMQSNVDAFVEIGAHPVLAASLHECQQHQDRKAAVLATLRRGEPERAAMLRSLAVLHARGGSVNWSAIAPAGARCVRLPAYPWQREHFWTESAEVRIERLSACPHPLLGRDLRSAEPSWEGKLDTRLLEWIKDHRVRGSVMFPAAGFVEMALAAAERTFGPGACVLEEIDMQRPLFVGEGDQAPCVQLFHDAQNGAFRILARSEGSEQPWSLHCLGRMHSEAGAEGPPVTAPNAIKQRLPHSISAELHYQRFDRSGLQYGTRFRGVQQIRHLHDEALGEVMLSSELEEELRQYRVHPALLDACFQVVAATMPDLQPQEHKLLLPSRIASVRWWRRPEGRHIFSHVRLTAATAKWIESDVTLLDPEGNVLIEVEGFRCLAIEARGRSRHGEDWLYHFEWQPKPLPGRQPLRRPADYLPDTRELGRRLQQETEELLASLGWVAHSWEKKCDALCLAFILRAFGQLGWVPRRGERITEQELVSRLEILPRHARVLSRYLALLAQAGWLRRSTPAVEQENAEWEVIADPDPVDITEQCRNLPFELSDLLPELMLIGNCGFHLAEILRGQLDPLQAVMPGGSTLLLEHLYHGSRNMRLHNVTIRKAVSAAIERLPEGRTLRILEIGAGTGGLTAHLLPKLPAGRVEYVFTDVSAFFLSRAEQRFSEFSCVQYRLFDLEKSPVEQGFQEHDFDIILAANVLHSTADLLQSLAHVSRLLVSEGLLILLEIDKCTEMERDLIFNDLVFALTEGWWRFTDTDLRPDGPLLSRPQWRKLLEETGFQKVAAISHTDWRSEAGLCVHLARGPYQDAVALLPPIPDAENDDRRRQDSRHWLLLADRTGVAEQLAEHFRTHGDTCRLVFSEDEIAPANEPASFGGIIHLWGLDAGAADAMSIATLEAAQDRGCYSVMRLVQAFAAAGRSAPLWLITRVNQRVHATDRVSPTQAPLWGLGRVVINELPAFRCRMVDLSDTVSPMEVRCLFDEIIADDVEEEIALRGDARYALRMVRTNWPELHRSGRKDVAKSFRLEIGTAGALENLTFRACPRQPPAPDEVEIEVCAAALNFRDVLKTLGIYPSEIEEARWLGDECAGRVISVGKNVTHVRPGDEVISAGLGLLGSHGTVPASLVMRKPPHLSFEQATTFPMALLTAEYALLQVGKLRAGERVLIHGATGGVGLAALQVARLVGAEIFATAGSKEKREFLRWGGMQHVMDSRALEFGREVMAATGGEGVDVVLNSLPGQAIAEGLACLRDGGRFVEIGKRDIYQHTRLDLHALRKNVSLCAVDMFQVLQRPGPGRALAEEIAEKIERGRLLSLPHRTFGASDIVRAMRHMAQAKHVGKVVLSFQDDDIEPQPALDDVPETCFEPDRTYLITGGLGGFGMKVAEWMVANGARHLVLVNRSGIASEAALPVVDAMEQRGARVIITAADVSCADEVARVLAMIAETLPPLSGIIHAAMVLEDGVLLRLDCDQFRRVTAPKMLGAWNLHLQTRGLPLEFFVMFSSVSSMTGNSGQANYAAANAFLDALAHHRRAAGLPAMTINWGILGEVGYIARHEALAAQLSRSGWISLVPAEALKVFGQLLHHQPTQVAVQSIDWHQLARQFPTVARSPRFQAMVQEDLLDSSADGTPKLTREILLSAPEAERGALVESYLRETIGKVLGTSGSKIAANRALAELGMDSLMAVELMNRIEAELALRVPTAKVMGSQNIAQLAQALLEMLQGPAPRSEREPPKDGLAARGAGLPITIEYRPLLSGALAGETEPFAAAALVYLPDAFRERTGLSREQLIHRWFQDAPRISGCLETQFGRIGIIALPLLAAEIYRDPQALVQSIMEALTLAGKLGARVVSLTGLIPSATEYGLAVSRALEKNPAAAAPAITTGHAATTAAVVMNLQKILQAAARSLDRECLGVLGLGSIGLSALRLLLRSLPHPAEITLCDPFRTERFLEEVKQGLIEQYGFVGAIRLAPSQDGIPNELFAQSLILGATNVAGVLDVTRVESGTLIVDDSAPPCFDLEVAARRFEQHADILFTNAGMLHAPGPVRELISLPEGVTELVDDDVIQDFVRRRPSEITACVLSSVLSTRFAHLRPTIGEVDIDAAAEHLRELQRLGFQAASLSTEGYVLEQAHVDRFRQRFGGHAYYRRRNDGQGAQSSFQDGADSKYQRVDHSAPGPV